MPEALYIQEKDRFVPTELTQGPWDPNAQHGGPPAALIGRAMESHEARPGFQIVRATFEILRPVPIAPVTVSVRTVRAGARVELLEASLANSDGEVVRATAWRMRTAEGQGPEVREEPEPPPGPETGESPGFLPFGRPVGYFRAVEWRMVRGDFLELGPATAWARLQCQLVEGEEPSPLARVLVPADAGNGISGTIDFARYLYINTDLTVHLQRMPVGEWVCLDSTSRIEPHGVGLAESVLSDWQGRIGSAAQSLFVAPRNDAGGS